MSKENDSGGLDFRGLILGFSGAALHHLGESSAAGEKPVVNLALAHQNIEIITLLAEKTHGNLSSEEESLLRQILIDLRMRFIEKSRVAK
jgi:Domain of unknown function (DUF1844)